MEPAEFQEDIRDAFPQYARRQDLPPIVGGQTPPPPVTNYHFLSEDGRWKLNLTKDFIALSTLYYPGWEEFARHLDQPLASFIRHYKPAYFSAGWPAVCQYLSRTKLGLEETPWRELFIPAYTGPLQDESEDTLLNWGCDMLVKLDSSSRAKIHAGFGRLQVKNAPQDQETKFILDLDLSMGKSCSLYHGCRSTWKPCIFTEAASLKAQSQTACVRPWSPCKDSTRCLTQKQ